MVITVIFIGFNNWEIHCNNNMLESLWRFFIIFSTLLLASGENFNCFKCTIIFLKCDFRFQVLSFEDCTDMRGESVPHGHMYTPGERIYRDWICADLLIEIFRLFQDQMFAQLAFAITVRPCFARRSTVIQRRIWWDMNFLVLGRIVSFCKFNRNFISVL